DLAVLRSIPGVTIAAPYGEQEMRAVVREAAASGRPHYIRTGRNAAYESLGVATTPGGVTWASDGLPDGPCLVSVGEEGTRLSRAACVRRPDLAHAHLTYLDREHLDAAAAELGDRHRSFLVVEE